MAMFQESLPSLMINGTPEEEIIRLKRFLMNMCEELDYTLSHISTSNMTDETAALLTTEKEAQTEVRHGGVTPQQILTAIKKLLVDPGIEAGINIDVTTTGPLPPMWRMFLDAYLMELGYVNDTAGTDSKVTVGRLSSLTNQYGIKIDQFLEGVEGYTTLTGGQLKLERGAAEATYLAGIPFSATPQSELGWTFSNTVFRDYGIIKVVTLTAQYSGSLASGVHGAGYSFPAGKPTALACCGGDAYIDTDGKLMISTSAASNDPVFYISGII